MTSFVTSTHCPVKNLKVGEQYEFRVSAENQYGLSEPLMTSEPIKACHPFSKTPSDSTSALLLDL